MNPSPGHRSRRPHRAFITMLLAVAMGCAAAGWAGAGTEDSSSVERGGVRVDASIIAQLYAWEVTNISAPPIVRFEMPQHRVYNQEVPPGWEWTHERGRFEARATHERFAIQPGQTRRFTARGGGGGSSLGLRPLTLGLASQDNGEVVLAKVWAPVEKPKSMVVLVAAMLIGIAGMHVMVMRWRKGVRG